MRLRSRRHFITVLLYSVLLCTLVVFMEFASAKQAGTEKPAWPGSLAANVQARSKITIRNQCKKAHSFTVGPSDVPYLQLPGTPNVQVAGRSSQNLDVVFNTTGMRPGDYRGSVAVKCETCGEERGCSQVNDILPVHLTVTPAVGIETPTPGPTPTATPRPEVSPTPAATPPSPPLVDFPSYLNGRITGRKINDTNCNGKIDANEPGLAGWTITAKNNGTGVTATAVTDASGSYSFNNLPLGIYTVSETLQSGWTQTMPGAPGTYTVPLNAAVLMATQKDFANCKKAEEVGEITGYKIFDRNCNGKIDDSDLGLAGWTITATNNTTGAMVTTVTDVNGLYSFKLPAGTYTISEGSQLGWSQTIPGGLPGTYTVQLAAGQVIRKDFANCRRVEELPGKITGRKIHDINCNGKDDNEPGLQGWTITATNTSTGVAVIAVTDASGFYSFNNLPAGTYTISETLQSGWTQSIPGGSGNYTVILAPGQRVQKDFGNCKKDGPSECATVVAREAVCKTDGSGGYTYSFTVTNTSGHDVNQILLTPAGGGLTLSEHTFDIPLHNGQSATITVDIGNVKPDAKHCFYVTLMTKDGPCCTVEVCPELPDCCGTATGKFECDPRGTYTGTFTITNTSPNVIKNIYLYPPAGVTMSQTYFAVTLAPGQSFTTPVISIKGAKPGRFCFRISMHTADMKDCCSIEVCIVLPECGIHIGAASTVLSSEWEAYDSRRGMPRRRRAA